MSKELRELLQSLEEKKAKVRGLLGEDKVSDAESLMEEVRGLQKKVALQQELEMAESNKLNDATPLNSGSTSTDKELEVEYKRVFLKGLRRQRITADDQSIISEYKNVIHEGGVSSDPD